MIHPNNFEGCVKNNLIAVKNRGKKALKRVEIGGKVIFYVGSHILRFLGYGIVKSKYFFNNRKRIWPDEQKKGKVIYPHRAKVESIKHNAEIGIRNILKNYNL